MQGLRLQMIVPDPVVLKQNDGKQVVLPIPSENNRWNDLHPMQKKKDVLKYTQNEVLNIHLETNDKARLIKAIYNSQFKPKMSTLKRSGTGCFPPEGKPYDKDKIKAFLQPYNVHSTPWRAQVDKIAEA